MDKTDIIKIINEANINNAYALATFYNKVCVGYYENGDLHFYETVDFDLCTQIRLFNEELELRIVKVDEKIYSKIIKDDDYKNKLNDEYMFISGNKIIEKNEKFTVIEQINRKVALPLTLSEEEVKAGIRLIVRNFCAVDENKQVTIVESRLVGFSKCEEEDKSNE